MKLISCIFCFLLSIPIFGRTGYSEGFIDNAGAKIHYKIFGEGAPVLIFNGGPGYSSEHMDGFAEKLSSFHFKVILFDQRGTGRSIVQSYDSLRINLDKVLSDAAILINKLGYESVNVMGHSFGGLLAMSFAKEYPKYVNKLILCSSAGINLDFVNYFNDNIAQRLMLGPDKTPPKFTDTSMSAIAFFRQVWINAPAYLYDKANIDIFRKLLTSPGSYDPRFARLIWSDLYIRKYDLSQKMGTFNAPTLVIQGRQDIIGDEVPIRIHDAIQQSHLVFLDKCGHVPWLDQPYEFFNTVTKFLSGY